VEKLLLKQAELESHCTSDSSSVSGSLVPGSHKNSSNYHWEAAWHYARGMQYGVRRLMNGSLKTCDITKL